MPRKPKDNFDDIADMPLTDEEMQAGNWMRGTSELPEAAQKAIARSRMGRPKSESPKPTITLRMDEEVISHLRSHKGYNALVESLLRREIEAGRL